MTRAAATVRFYTAFFAALAAIVVVSYYAGFRHGEAVRGQMDAARRAHATHPATP